MAVMIDGVEIPKSCIKCEWHEYYGGDYDYTHACRRTGRMNIENAENSRADNCPLREDKDG